MPEFNAQFACKYSNNKKKTIKVNKEIIYSMKWDKKNPNFKYSKNPVYDSLTKIGSADFFLMISYHWEFNEPNSNVERIKQIMYNKKYLCQNTLVTYWNHLCFAKRGIVPKRRQTVFRYMTQLRAYLRSIFRFFLIFNSINLYIYINKHNSI